MKTPCLLIAIVLFSRLCQAQMLQSEHSVCERLKSILHTYTEHQVFRGHLLLAQKGQTLCEYNSALPDRDKERSISAPARFPIASLSKPIVASLLLKLQENGALNLHESIDKYLTDFNAAWGAQVTLHHLLANRSGLPNHFALPNWDTGRYQTSLPDQALLQLIAQMELAFAPGSDYRYSNLGWLLLAEIVERATGQGFEENLQKHIFTPLSMSQTGFVKDTDVALATGFRWGDQGDWQPHENLNMQILRAGAGLYSTAFDLVHFLRAVHANAFLSSQSKQRMFSDNEAYAWRTLSIQLASEQEKTLHSYDGQLEGHSSLFYHFPEDDISLVLLANNGMGFEHKKALADDVARAFFDLSYPDRRHSPSFQLHKSLVADQWNNAVSRLQGAAIKSLDSAILIKDLAQQLSWSAHTAKAIDLYLWLTTRYPDNRGLLDELSRLCERIQEYSGCKAGLGAKVGMRLLPFKDYDRKAWRSDLPRPLTTHVFYATRDAQLQTLYLGPEHAPLFKAGTVVNDAKPVLGKRPLILMSHGTGGSAPQMLWLAEALVEAGFIVAAVNHHGNTAFESEKLPEGFLLWWERARDLQVVYRKLLGDPGWRDLIDADKVATVGFSLGGYTALSVIGGVTDKALFDDHCRRSPEDFSCQPQPEFETVLEAFEKVVDAPQVVQSIARQHDNYHMPELKAAVVIAPAIVHAFQSGSLANSQTPALLVVGEQDKIAPSASNAEYAHSLLPNSQLIVIPNGHHYSFLSPCTGLGKRALPLLCEDPHGVKRESLQFQVKAEIVEFLEQVFYSE